MLTCDVEGCHGTCIHHSLNSCLHPHRTWTHLYHRVAAKGGGEHSTARDSMARNTTGRQKHDAGQTVCFMLCCSMHTNTLSVGSGAQRSHDLYTKHDAVTGLEPLYDVT
jgi:hypothetical protein